MPMYDYFCSTCNSTIGRFRSMDNRLKELFEAGLISALSGILGYLSGRYD